MWVDTPEEAALRRALKARGDNTMPSPDALSRIRSRIAQRGVWASVRALFNKKPLPGRSGKGQ